MLNPDTFVFGAKAPSEQRIKAFVLDHLRHQDRRWEGADVANEFCLGESGVRADLAILGPEFLGIEIKSKHDSLKRLPSQMKAYKSYFDRVVLAVAQSHVRHLDWSALREVDVWQVSESGHIELVAGRTKMPTARCFSELLTAGEAARVRGSASADDYQSVFFDAFTRRHGPTSRRFWSLVEGRSVTVEDLRELSRFRKDRERAQAWAQQQQHDWSSWSASLAQVAHELA